MRPIEIRTKRIFKNLIKQNQKLYKNNAIAVETVQSSVQCPEPSVQSVVSSVQSPAFRVRRPESIRGYQGQNSGGSRLVAGLESASATRISCSQILEASSSFLKLLQASSRFFKQQPEPGSVVTEISRQKTNHKNDVFCSP